MNNLPSYYPTTQTTIYPSYVIQNEIDILKNKINSMDVEIAKLNEEIRKIKQHKKKC